MSRYKLVFIFIALFAISGCVSSSPSAVNKYGLDSDDSIPSWVYSPPEVVGYVYGVGMASIYSTPADALQRAGENSRVELVKQLKVTVSGETEASVKREIHQGKSKITRTVFNYAKSSIDEIELPGIRIINTAVSRTDKQAFALCELNKSEAELDLSEKLETIEKKIDIIGSQPDSGSKIIEIKRLVPALKLIEERNRVVSNLKLVSTFSDEEFEKSSYIQLESKIAGLIDSLVIVIKPDLSSKNLASGIRKALSDQGVRVRMDGEGDLYLKFSASLDTVLRNGIYYTFASGQASLMEKNNDVLNEFSTKVKDGSGDKNLSVKRAIEKLADELGNSVAKGLFKI